MGGIGVLSPPGEEGGKEEGAVCSDGGARAASWMDSVNRPRNTASAEGGGGKAQRHGALVSETCGECSDCGARARGVMDGLTR